MEILIEITFVYEKLNCEGHGNSSSIRERAKKRIKTAKYQMTENVVEIEALHRDMQCETENENKTYKPAKMKPLHLYERLYNIQFS